MRQPAKVQAVNIIASLFILLFVYTALSKLAGPESFRYVLSRSPLIGPYASAFSILLPLTELLVTGLLFFERTRITGFWLSLLLMTVFTGYLFYMIHFAKELPCSCGGVLQNLSWRQHAWFNILFILLAIAGLHMGRNRSLSPQQPAI